MLDIGSLHNLIDTCKYYNVSGEDIIKSYISHKYKYTNDTVENWKAYSKYIDKNATTINMCLIKNGSKYPKQILMLEEWTSNSHIHNFIRVINRYFNITVDGMFMMCFNKGTVTKCIFVKDTQYKDLTLYSDNLVDQIFISTDPIFCDNIQPMMCHTDTYSEHEIIVMRSVINNLVREFKSDASIANPFMDYYTTMSTETVTQEHPSIVNAENFIINKIQHHLDTYYKDIYF